MKTDKFIFWFCLTILFGSFVFTIYFAQMVLYPPKVAEFKTPIQLDKKKVKPGESLYVSYRFDKYVKNMPTIHRRIIDNLIYQFPPIIGASGPGKNINIKRFVEIPHIIPPGKYYLEFIFVYEINFMRTEIITIRSDWFEVMR